MKVILTGFQPFDGEIVNASYEAIRKLPDQIENAWIIKKELPVEFGRAGQILKQIIAQEKPDLVLCIGQATGRSEISVEKVAINLQDARIPDNAGHQPKDQPIIKEGPTAYFAAVDVRKIVQAIHQALIPAKISYSAGTYVCNDVFYHLLALIDQTYAGMQGGFIHVPCLPEQVVNKSASIPSMALDDITRALEAAITAVLKKEDQKQLPDKK